MDRDEVIRLAREAGADFDIGHRGDEPPQLRMHERAIFRFAHLVAQREREECAQIAMLTSINGIEASAAIRQRGNQ